MKIIFKFLITAIIIISLITSSILLYYKINYECGDSVCEFHELQTCKQDCKEDCTFGFYNSLIAQGNSKTKIKSLVRKECTMTWDELYLHQRLKNNVSDYYVLRTKDYDYDNQEIKELITSFRANDYKYAYELIADIGEYTYQNVEYRGNLNYEDCLSNQASDVLERKYGLCSTISKLDIALLRGMGIASRSVTGCIRNTDYQCKPIVLDGGLKQALLGKEVRKPKVQPIKIENGTAVSTGGLHTWTEVWIPELGWIILEPTTGYMVERSCIDYQILKIEPNMFEFCGLNYALYKNFIDQCTIF